MAYNGQQAAYLSVLNAPVAAEPLTISCWFNPDDVAYQSCLVSLQDASGSAMYTVYQDDGGEGSLWVYDGTLDSIKTTNLANSGAWNHLGGVFASDTSRRVILNGDTANEATDTTNRSVGLVSRVFIGVCYYGVAYHDEIDGSIGEVAIWSAGLATDELLALSKRVSPESVRPNSLVAYWRLVRNLNCRINASNNLTNNGGATVAAHCPIKYPASPIFSFLTAAPAAGGYIYHILQQ